MYPLWHTWVLPLLCFHAPAQRAAVHMCPPLTKAGAAMNTTKRATTLFEVHLDDGSTWTGTQAELRREHPECVKYAQVVHPSRATRAVVLTDIEHDFAYDPRPRRLPNS